MNDTIRITLSAIAGFILGAYIVFLLFMFEKQDGAMEVYKGNTTLEYTIRDGVKIDSCVIFLKK